MDRIIAMGDWGGSPLWAAVSGQRIQSGPVLIDTLMIPTATIVARDFTECFIVVRVVIRLAPISYSHNTCRAVGVST